MNLFQLAVQAFQHQNLDKSYSLAAQISSGDPHYGQAMHLRGVIKFHQKDYLEAKRLYEIAHQLLEQNLEITNGLVMCNIQLGDLICAENLLNDILLKQPDSYEGRKNLARLRQIQGRNDEAFEIYTSLIGKNPFDQNVLMAIVLLARTSNQKLVLEKLFSIELHLNPHNSVVKSIYAQYLVDNCQYQAAIAILGTMDTSNLTAQALMAFCLKESGLFEQAKLLYSSLIERLKQNNSGETEFLHKLRNNLAMIDLTLQNYTEGWRNFTCRPSLINNKLPLYQQYLPENLQGKTILLCRDQGLGDELFFLRYASLLEDRGAKIICLVSDKIIPLLTLCTHLSCISNINSDHLNYDYIISVADLPHVLNHPNPINALTLHLNPDFISAMTSKYQYSNSPRKRIGITWRAGITGENQIATTLCKSFPLETLVECLRDFSGEVYVLQRAPNAEEMTYLRNNLALPVHDFSALNDDLVSMTTLLSQLDDYIGVSNTNMHIRGSIAKRAAVLIPFPPEWRWGLVNNKSSWYPTFDLYRMSECNNWDDVVPQLKKRIRALI